MQPLRGDDALLAGAAPWRDASPRAESRWREPWHGGGERQSCQLVGAPVAPRAAAAPHSFPTRAGVTRAPHGLGYLGLESTGQLPSLGGWRWETEAGPGDAPHHHLPMMWVMEAGTGTHIWGDTSLDNPSAPLQEFYPKKEPGFHPPAKDQAPPQLLGKGQDRDGEGEPVVPELPGAPWRDGRAGASSVMPAPHARTPPPSTSHPLFLLQPGAAGGCGGPWVGTRPHAADFPPEPGPGRPSEPKDERLAYQSLQPGSPLGPEEPDPSPPLTDGQYPMALAKPEPPPACLCTTPGCDGCPGVGCGVLGPFEPTLGNSGGRFPCPPTNHTKLKKTWLTRHSEQSLPRCKAPRRDGGPEPAGEGKRSAKRPHGIADGPRAAGEGAGAAKRGAKATEHVAAACLGDGTESGGDPEEKRMELGEGGKVLGGCTVGQGRGRWQHQIPGEVWHPGSQRPQHEVGTREGWETCCAWLFPSTAGAGSDSQGRGV